MLLKEDGQGQHLLVTILEGAPGPFQLTPELLLLLIEMLQFPGIDEHLDHVLAHRPGHRLLKQSVYLSRSIPPMLSLDRCLEGFKLMFLPLQTT